MPLALSSRLDPSHTVLERVDHGLEGNAQCPAQVVQLNQIQAPLSPLNVTHERLGYAQCRAHLHLRQPLLESKLTDQCDKHIVLVAVDALAHGR